MPQDPSRAAQWSIVTVTGNIFNLPAGLNRKNVPALIARDERHLQAVKYCLGQSIAELSGRLDAERRNPGGSGQEALERDLRIHQQTARLHTLRRYGADLCLGRMVLTDNSDPVYVGRLSLTGSDGTRLLIDWRSAAVEPYFGATHANPMGIVSRRRFRWAHGRVVDYWDEVFTPEALEGNAALDDQSAFIASLGSIRSPRMRDVLGTIQSDQDAIIRAGSRGTLVVDGGPGTGKTVVALHRAAYLLYSDPRIGHRRGGVLLVGPHRPYLAYIADVLPSLGEEGVHICTIRNLVPEGVDAVEESDPRAMALKASADPVAMVENAVRFHEKPPQGEMVIETEWGDVELGPDDWAAAFDSPEPGAPHNEARDQVWEELLAILLRKLGNEVPEGVVQSALQPNQELRMAFGRAWPLLEPTGVIRDLWAVPDYLRACAPWLRPEDLVRLRRPIGRAWTISDLPFLDAARQRIGDPEASGRQRRRDAAIAAERELRNQVMEELIAADDSDLHLMSMLREQDVQNSLVGEAGIPAIDPDDLTGPFSHVIVDEAQELTDAEWRMLLLRCPTRSFTVVGDRAQARHGFTETWTERLGRLGLDHVTLAPLTINYRTPEEVMFEAEAVIRSAIPDANVPTSIRRGGVPVVHGTVSDRDSVLVRWLAEHNEGTACVIGDPTFQPTQRVQSLTPSMSKGLEFDFVVLSVPEVFGNGIEGVVDRYVSMTRATQQLVVLHHDL